MHAKHVLWVDYDVGSLAVLLIGIGAVSFLAFGGF